MSISKKDYVGIASVIVNCTTSDNIPKIELVVELAKFFGKDNPSFDWDRFMKACYPDGIVGPARSDL